MRNDLHRVIKLRMLLAICTRLHPRSLYVWLALAVAGSAACGDPDPVPSTVTISPATVTLDSFDETMRLTATVQDQDGLAMPGFTITWSSSDESVVTVDSDGLAKATGNGTAAVRASVEGASGTAEVTVEQQVAGVRVSPGEGVLGALGDTIRLSATATDANGHTIGAVDFTWSSDDESVVTVDTAGLVTAAGHGMKRVWAAAGAVGDYATITVDLQRGWLLKFYEATGGPRWYDHRNWATNAPLSRWYGIRTDSQGNVTVLDLQGNGLIGSIPPELGNFQNLDSLDLAWNELTGSIPPELGNLEKLTFLALWINQLTGSIPPELTGALPRQLMSLALSTFHWVDTDLCSPTDDNFQEWLESIDDHQGAGECEG